MRWAGTEAGLMVCESDTGALFWYENALQLYNFESDTTNLKINCLWFGLQLNKQAHNFPRIYFQIVHLGRVFYGRIIRL